VVVDSGALEAEVAAAAGPAEAGKFTSLRNRHYLIHLKVILCRKDNSYIAFLLPTLDMI
jgi:hypothetical protein